MIRALAAVLVALAVVLFAASAGAEQVELKANVDPATVELGDTVALTLQALVHDGSSPADAQPGAHPGFVVAAASSSPVQMNVNLNGQRSVTSGLVTTWTLRATALGAFTLGPPTVQIGGARRSAQALRVRVVPRGQAPARPRAQPFDPFGGSSPLDPFKGLFDFGDDARAEPPPPATDPKLALDAQRAPIAFLHATIDKTRAVVGEQVTLSVYLYQDPFAHAGQPADVHEATATDFAKRSLVDGGQHAIAAGNAMVGGKPWVVALIRKDALFPLKAGRLAIEPMSLTLPQARAGLRESERLFVDVAEPPLAGRPPGYAIGDVGDMSLAASVAPRAIDQDGAVGVTLELRGTGNMPSQLAVPVAPGIEWLDAQTKDAIKVGSNDKLGGTRSFSYVVRVHRAGAVDLGEIRLPYFDPDARAYAVARASLGIVDVRPGNARDAGIDEAEPVLPGLPRPRAELEGPHDERFLSERPVYWGLVFGAPLACVVAIGAGGLVRRLRERRASRAPSPERIARERRAEAETACERDDGPAAMGAIARALEAGVLARTGVNVRGGSLDATAKVLEEAGVDAVRAAEVVKILSACHDARFSPEGVAIERARETWARAKTALADLRGGTKA